MAAESAFHLETPYGRALTTLLKNVEERVKPGRPVNLFLAGGMAVHLYLGSRMTSDVDIEFDARILIPSDVSARVLTNEGRPTSLYIDTNYNPSFALVHENYREDSVRIPLDLEFFQLHLLSPVDLAVSKISRLGRHDREDIANLVKAGLTTADAICRRANEAKAYYIGDLSNLEGNIRDVVEMARSIEGLLPPNNFCQPERPSGM